MTSHAPAVRRGAGLYAYERALARRGFSPVAGADETGRGACAGPLVVAAVMLPGGRRGRVPGLADSKLLTSAAREKAYAEIVKRAVSWTVVTIPAAEVDQQGVHRGNLGGMRRAFARLEPAPAYVLTDGFPVRGLGVPGLAIRRGDRVAACVAAASVVAKVTRDRMMCEVHERFPDYDFASHKGYVTPGHTTALATYGPCAEHRFSYVNVSGAIRGVADDAEEVEFGDTGGPADVEDGGADGASGDTGATEDTDAGDAENVADEAARVP